MKLALIPPYSRIIDTTKTNYQLALAHLLGQDATYTAAYNAMCQAKHQYVILDNGAYEGSLVDANELLQLTVKYKVDEVVMPDKMKSAEVTIAMARTFYRMYNNAPMRASRLKFMFVVQGNSWYEMAKCLQWGTEQSWISTIAIPRHTLETCLDGTARLAMAKLVRDNSNKNVHFLGASPLWTEEIIEAAASGLVRGMDTSMPYVYGIAGKSWPSLEVVDSALTRNVYFDTIPSQEQEELFDLNIDRMLKYV